MSSSSPLPPTWASTGRRTSERCWPASLALSTFEYKRLVEAEGEVVVTYEATRTAGRRFRNTEIFGFDGEKVSRVEVYFGWDVE